MYELNWIGLMWKIVKGLRRECFCNIMCDLKVKILIRKFAKIENPYLR